MMRFRTVRLSDPNAAGIHQPGRIEVRRFGWHGSVIYISGIRKGQRNYTRERAWMVVW